MFPAIKLARKYWLLLLIAGGLTFAGVYFGRQLKTLGQPLHFSFKFLALALVLQAIYWYLLSTQWRRIVAEVSARRISLKESFFQLCLVSIGKYLPGKVWGMVARGTHMKQRHGIAPGQIINATYVEQFLLLYSAGLLTAVLLVAQRGTYWTWLLLVLAVAGAIVGQRYNRAIVSFIARLYARFGKKDRQEATIKHIPPAAYYSMLVSYVVIWILLGLIFACLYFTFFSAPFEFSTVCTMVLANTVGITAGFLAVFAPGGIGVREAVSSGLLAVKISLASAVLLSLLFRLWLVALEIGLGVVAFWGSGRALLAMLRNANQQGKE